MFAVAKSPYFAVAKSPCFVVTSENTLTMLSVSGGGAHMLFSLVSFAVDCLVAKGNVVCLQWRLTR